jgi:hypothetical protein
MQDALNGDYVDELYSSDENCLRAVLSQHDSEFIEVISKTELEVEAMSVKAVEVGSLVQVLLDDRWKIRQVTHIDENDISPSETATKILRLNGSPYRHLQILML